MVGQVAYHLMAKAGTARAPWAITTIVSCLPAFLPVLVLGMGTGLPTCSAPTPGPRTHRTRDRTTSQPAVAFALDILALMDVLHIETATLAGYDWGSRTGDIIAALWPRRVKALVSVTGYLITNLAAQKMPLLPKAENDWWYQYYFDTERGMLGLTKYRYELGLFVWEFNSPTWKFSTETYDQTAAAFNNPAANALTAARFPLQPRPRHVELIQPLLATGLALIMAETHR
jgi:pimeloyl-ACP methyl ester carboxylesterase